MKFDRVIWDFNGTLLDDVCCGIESANELLTRHGLPIIKSVDDYHSLFGFPIRDYYQRLGFDFSRLSYEALAHEWVAIYLEKVKTAPLREGVLPLLAAIRAKGIKQTVLSMTEQSMLLHQLSLLGITSCFDEICGLTDIYATSKLALAADWRKRHPLERVLFVGDTVHDAESAAVIGCECLLITGGHESEQSLRAHQASVIHNPDEILSFLR
ncbi:MAG: HAD family hydrolase [Ruminococcaceae bacterium]|nr:HAD family hydrolase [Oscillospiraceae bacterium]